MQTKTTRRFDKSYQDAPREVQKAFDLRSRFLLRDVRHPSLRAKKYDESSDIWQVRITDDWRLYFRIEGDTYVFLDMIRHPK